MMGQSADDEIRPVPLMRAQILGAKLANCRLATKFQFVINLKAAKQIGLTVPNRVLERATTE